jgi:hypothetical protein
MHMKSWLSLLSTAALIGCYGVQPPSQTPTQQTPPMMQPTTPVDNTIPVIVEFSASKLMIHPGEMVDLTYNVTGAENVSIQTDTGVVVMDRSTLLSGTAYPRAIQDTTNYVLVATYKDKSVSKTITVTVGGAVVDLKHATIESFSATPASVMPGASATLEWKTSSAQTGVVTQDSALVLTIASTDLNMGSYQITPTQTAVYTIKMKGSDGQEVTLTTSVQVGNGTPLSGRNLFDQGVALILQQKCSQCHADAALPGPDFLGTDKNNTAAYYTSITSDTRFMTAVPENSLLLLKGQHTGPAFCSPESNMTAPCTPTTEKATVTAWLVQEARERMTTMPMPTMGSQPRTLQEAMTRFGACMDRATWDQTYGASQQTEIAYQNTTQGRCYSCHSTGTAGSFLSQNSGDTFDQNRLMPNILKLVQPTYNPDGTLKDLAPANRWRDKGNEATQGGTHPTFNLSAARQGALDQFLTQTLTKYRNYAVPCASPPPTP